MTEHEQYFFDVNGYLVIEDMLSAEMVAEMNSAFDNAGGQQVKLREGDLRLAGDSGKLAGRHGRGDTGLLMQWPEPWCQPFRQLLTHHRTLRIMLDLIGPGFRHSSADGITMDRGAEGLNLHGSASTLDVRSSSGYQCQNGVMANGLVTVMYQLADINAGDGGLVVIPGSHRASFALPADVKEMEAREDWFHEVPVKKGSAIVFTEATTHGTKPWRGDHQRRTLLYRYAHGAINHFSSAADGADPDTYAPFRAQMSPLGQAVLEPPHGGKRPNILALVEEEAAEGGRA